MHTHGSLLSVPTCALEHAPQHVLHTHPISLCIQALSHLLCCVLQEVLIYRLVDQVCTLIFRADIGF